MFIVSDVATGKADGKVMVYAWPTSRTICPEVAAGAAGAGNVATCGASLARVELSFA